MEDYQRRDTTRVHALHGASIPGTHQRSMPALRKNGGETDWPSIPRHHLGDGTPALSIPSHSRILREDTRLCSSSTTMLVSLPQHIMMWLPREWPPCQTQGIEPIYKVDQAWELLPWSCSQERPTQHVPAPGQNSASNEATNPP